MPIAVPRHVKSGVFWRNESLFGATAFCFILGTTGIGSCGKVFGSRSWFGMEGMEGCRWMGLAFQIYAEYSMSSGMEKRKLHLGANGVELFTSSQLRQLEEA